MQWGRRCVVYTHPLGRHPSGQTTSLGRHTPKRQPLKRVVRIVLECFLVNSIIELDSQTALYYLKPCSYLP